jgi:hypothetical protein
MLVTAAFAGLLIYGPYELPSKSAAPSINVPPKPADGAVADKPIVAPPTLQALGALQEEPHGAVADKPIVAPATLGALGAFQEGPVLQRAVQTRVVQVKRSRRWHVRHRAKPLREAMSGSDESPPVAPCCRVADQFISPASPSSPNSGSHYRFRIFTEIGR